MAIIQAPFFLVGAAESAYAIEQSIMLDGSADYLTLTPSFDASNNTKVTFSWWQKRSNFGTVSWLYDAGSNNDQMQFAAADDLEVSLNATTDGYLNTTALFRDPTAWQHFVVSFDTGNSTSGDRMRVWNNGTEITNFDTDNAPSVGYALDFLAKGIVQNLGRRGNNSQFWGGYLAEFIGLDGISVTDASKFGETDNNGIWIPKDPSSTDNISDWGGSNSFWLKFADATNLGFNSRPTELTANAGTYKIDNSLWLDGSSNYLYRTPSSGSASTQYTLSIWFKRGPFSEQYLFMQGSDASNLDVIEFTGDHRLQIRWYPNTVAADLITTQVFLDPTAWQHLVISVDTTLGAAGNRIKIYVNGVRVTAFDTQSNPSSSATSMIGGTSQMTIGRKTPGTTWYYPGYLAEYIFMDGYAGTATDFGGWDSNGNWLPVDPSGLASVQGHVLIAQDTGSTIGTMTVRTANAFDGNNDQADGACATHSSALSTATIGKDFGDGNAKAVNRVKCWGYNGGGFTSNASQTCTISVIGSNTGLGSDEVTLFTSETIADTTDANAQDFSFENTTAYRYVYIKLTQGVSNYFFVAELEFYHESTVGFGTNGFHLDFADSSAPGNDVSGNNNDFAVGGTIATTQTTTDSPTNTSGDNEGNHWTLTPLQSNNTLTGGNLAFTGASNYSNYSTGPALPMTGKWYWELKAVGSAPITSSANYDTYVGVLSTNVAIPSGSQSSNANLWVWGNMAKDASGANGQKHNNSSATLVPAVNFGDNSIMMIAVDMDNSKIYFGNDGTWAGSANPATGSNPAFSNLSGQLMPYQTIYADSATYNFGATAFAHTPPTGFKALNTANLSASTVTDPRAYWSNSLYYGTAQNRSVRQCFDSTGTAWTPDFVWIKGRSHAGEHVLLDSVRGVTKVLTPDSNAAEFTDTKSLTSFDEGGFTLGVGDDRNDSNDDGKTYVAWCMKAGGAASSNGNGSITSSVSAADHGGFSIATWTGNGSAGATIGHGLSRKPAMGIFRRLSLAQDWAVYHDGLDASAPEDKYVNLNLTNDVQDATWLNDTAPTTSVWTLGTSGYVNTSSETFVGYFFARTPGLIGIGTYTGNNSTDGPYIVVDDGAAGFRPAFLIIKEYSGSNNGMWFMRDSARSPYNSTDLDLYANSTDEEYTDSNSDIDFTANGFKIRANAGGYNESGAKNLYIAFADQPFNLAKAR